jgi:hypothetical protein
LALAGDLRGPCFVRNCLHRGRVERQKHHLDAIVVHLAQPPIVNVHDAAFDFLPHAVGKIATGILKRFRNGKVLLERDLALHAPPLPHRDINRPRPTT